MERVTLIFRDIAISLLNLFFDFITEPARDGLRWIDNQFTLFCRDIDEIVETRTLLMIPEHIWKYFNKIVFINSFLSCLTFMTGLGCFIFGLYNSTYYTRVNCDNGVNIWIPLNGMIANWTGVIAIKALQVRWAAFVHFVFMIVMTPLMIFATIFAALQIGVWQREQSTSRGGSNSGYQNRNLNALVSFLSFTNVFLSCCIIAVYFKFWLPTPRQNRRINPIVM